MTCGTVQELLTDYLERRIDDDLYAQVKLHISRCANCREEFKAERSLSQWFQARGVEPVSSRFTQNLMSRLGVMQSKPPQWFENLLELSNYWAPSLAAVLVMIFAGRTLLAWIDRIRLFGQQAAGAIENIPSNPSFSQFLTHSTQSSYTLSVLLTLIAVGGLAFGVVRILKH
jgi:predicted anti-sigma-YlaC factor YlaD